MENRLYKFVKIAETGSFTRAAQALRTSQPGLSMAIKKLERELGAKLLKRREGKLELTPAGELAYNHAKELNVLNGNLRHVLQRLDSQKPRVAIGMIDSIAGSFLAAGNLLAEIESQASVTLSVNNSRYLLQSILQDQNPDIIFVVAPDQPLPTILTVESLGAEPLIGVSSPANLQQIQADLRKSRIIKNFLAYDKGSRTHKLIKKHFAEKGIAVESVFHSTSPGVILQLLLSGRGSAVLPRSLVAGHIKNGQLTTFTGVIPRPIAAIRPTGKLLPSAIRDLTQTIRVDAPF